jgi:hypothetical protein
VYVGDPDDQGPSWEPISLYHNQKSVNAFTYATQCYREGESAQNELCETFARSTLPFTSERNASCPFAGGICKSDIGNILLDSGVLSSHLHLGLNQSPQFTLRYQTHCAPLKTAGFTDTVMAPNSSQARHFYRYGVNGTHVFAFDTRNGDPSPLVFDVGNYKVT